LRKESRTIKSLEEKLIILNREDKKLRKRDERLTQVKQSVPGKETSASKAQFNNTPKSKANAEIRELGLTPRKSSKGDPCGHWKRESFPEKSSREGRGDRERESLMKQNLMTMKTEYKQSTKGGLTWLQFK
jgi:hypothetical protein